MHKSCWIYGVRGFGFGRHFILGRLQGASARAMRYAQRMGDASFRFRLEIHWEDVAGVRTLINEYKQGRCRLVEEAGATYADCIEGFDAADIKIAFPRSKRL